MTERTLTADSTGPVNFDATSNAADIHIAVLASANRAQVTVTTTATSGPSHDAVQSATLTRSPGSLSATLRDEGATVVSTGYGSVTVAGRNTGVISTGSGSVVMSGGRVWVNGVEVTAAGATGASAGPLAPITIRATLPAGSSIDVRTRSGQVTAVGALASATARTTSGDIALDRCGAANLSSVSGDLKVDAAASVAASTTSGDIRVGDVGAFTAVSVSGDVRVRDTNGAASASTTSGDVTIGYSGPMRPVARSVSGDVKVRPR